MPLSPPSLCLSLAVLCRVLNEMSAAVLSHVTCGNFCTAWQHMAFQSVHCPRSIPDSC